MHRPGQILPRQFPLIRLLLHISDNCNKSELVVVVVVLSLDANANRLVFGHRLLTCSTHTHIDIAICWVMFGTIDNPTKIIYSPCAVPNESNNCVWMIYLQFYLRYYYKNAPTASMCSVGCKRLRLFSKLCLPFALDKRTNCLHQARIWDSYVHTTANKVFSYNSYNGMRSWNVVLRFVLYSNLHYWIDLMLSPI